MGVLGALLTLLLVVASGAAVNASDQPYASRTTGYTTISQVIGQLMSSGNLAGWIQRHVLYQGYAPETTDALLQQQWWRRASSRVEGSGQNASAGKDYSFVDCTPLYQVDHSWSTWILNVRVHVPLCGSICLDYPACSTSVPLFVGKEDNTLKTTQFCDVTVIGNDGENATTVTLSDAPSRFPQQLCRNIVDAPRIMREYWGAKSRVSNNDTLRRRLKRGQELRAITITGPTSTPSPMITFADLWTHMRIQPLQLYAIDTSGRAYPDWYVLREVDPQTFQPAGVTSSASSPASTPISALIAMSFINTAGQVNAYKGDGFGWNGASYLIPAGTSTTSWVWMSAIAHDAEYRNRLNGPCPDTYFGMAQYLRCVLRQGTVSQYTAMHAGCVATENPVVWIGNEAEWLAGSKTASPKDDYGLGSDSVCGIATYATCGEYSVPVLILNEPEYMGNETRCPFSWSAADGSLLPHPGVASFMYPAAAQLSSTAFRESTRSVQHKWAAGTVDDEMLIKKLQLVNISAVASNRWMRFTSWNEEGIWALIHERLEVLIVQSNSYKPPSLPTGAVFLTAMSGQFVAVASVFGRNFGILDDFILARLSLFGYFDTARGGRAMMRGRLIVLFALYLVAFLIPLVPPTIAAWVTLKDINRVVSMNVPQSVQFAQLNGTRLESAYLVTMAEPYAEITVRYGTVAAVTAVLAAVVVALAAWTTFRVWRDHSRKSQLFGGVETGQRKDGMCAEDLRPQQQTLMPPA